MNQSADIGALTHRLDLFSPDRHPAERALALYAASITFAEDGVMAKAIERNDLDCVQLAMNPARAARFEELALPAANKKNLGVILMKVTGQDKLMVEGGATAEALLRYAWSLPVSTAVCGMPKLEFLDANAAAAKAFASSLSPAEMDRLRGKYAGSTSAMARFFTHHRDDGAWTA